MYKSSGVANDEMQQYIAAIAHIAQGRVILSLDA